MKKMFLLVMLLMIGMLTGCSYHKVPAGNVGVQFDLYGSDKGVQTEEKSPGRYWLTYNQEIYNFPTFTQTYTWTKSPSEDSPQDESLTFGTVEGLTVNADVGITYHVDPKKVTVLFQKYRAGVDEITRIYLRNMVRDALVKDASVIGVESVYGKGKAALIEEVQHDVSVQVAPIGIVIEKVYWIGELRLPPNVVNSINAKIQATQMAQQRENEVAQATAEAQKEVAKAQGDAQVITLKATAEANAIRLQGEALRQSPEVIQLRWVEKWNGATPIYQMGSGSGSLIQLPAPSPSGK